MRRFHPGEPERDEEPLLGGCQTEGVVRVGETVRRPVGSHSPFVHRLLEYLEETSFDGSPRFLGMDEKNREILTFIEGEALHDESDYPLSDARLVGAAEMIRCLHDATAGSDLAGDSEIVAHNELGPHNTVFAGESPVAFIDWDEAAPGTRLFDLANAVWSFVNVGEGGGSLRDQARRIHLMCDAYGWSDTAAIVDEIAADFGRALRNHERAGRTKPAGVFREMLRWMEDHSPELKRLARD